MKKLTLLVLIAFFGIIFFRLNNPTVLGVDCSLIVDSSAKKDCENGQNKLDKLLNQVDQTQKQLQGSQVQLQKNKVQVNTTQTVLQQTETEIARKEAEIKNLNDRIELNRKILGSYLQEIYFNDQEDPLVSLVLNNDQSLNDLTENTDSLISIKEKVLNALGDIKDDKQQLNDAQEQLATKKIEHEKLLSNQLGQQADIKQDITQAQATLGELNAKVNKLKSELSSLLGANVSFDDVMKAADFAAGKANIRKDFLLGMLVVESDLGRYTGGCTADKSKMSGNRLTLFKDICSSLNYDWKKRKVSCPPASYKGTGGAMGVAQFMADTWVGYKSQITSLTGSNPPDPWDLTDGIVAMAIKLARGGATSKSGECNAAKLYLSGTTSKTYNWYCDKVSYWSKNYEDKLN